MGKKAKLKAMRKPAQEMPEIKQNISAGIRVTGAELIRQGIREVQGVPVNPIMKYKGTGKIERPLNHYRQMKKLYNQHGKHGVGSYLAAIHQYVNKPTQVNAGPS